MYILHRNVVSWRTNWAQLKSNSSYYSSPIYFDSPLSPTFSFTLSRRQDLSFVCRCTLVSIAHRRQFHFEKRYRSSSSSRCVVCLGWIKSLMAKGAAAARVGCTHRLQRNRVCTENTQVMRKTKNLTLSTTKYAMQFTLHSLSFSLSRIPRHPKLFAFYLKSPRCSAFSSSSFQFPFKVRHYMILFISRLPWLFRFQTFAAVAVGA